MLCRKAANTSFIVIGLIRLVLNPTIYHTRGKFKLDDSLLNKMIIK